MIKLYAHSIHIWLLKHSLYNLYFDKITSKLHKYRKKYHEIEMKTYYSKLLLTLPSYIL